ncbi:MAG: type IV toxin-antitoxin system AbiEi family antitoxin domain-containing protein [Gammaproteobacteria bacterium]|nr:type IV toxin-antitoxin system AbiEi family antitoxin domain-containing protein [Gammaproteobacteria bacterium]
MTDYLRAIEKEHGCVTPKTLSAATGCLPSSARVKLSNLRKRGQVVKLSHGVYRLTGDDDDLVGIPSADGVPNELLRRAVTSLIAAGRALSAILDADPEPALAEWCEGAMAEQGRQGAMLTLMLGGRS